MSKKSADQVPTVAPKFNVEAYARESERRIQSSGTVDKGAGIPGSMPIPKAARTGVDVDIDPSVLPTTVPLLVARERVTELLTYPTESFLLAFIDGVRDVAALASVSGLPRDLVSVTIADLAKSGVVVLRQRSR